jgi:glycyl-tRNA synthetase
MQHFMMLQLTFTPPQDQTVTLRERDSMLQVRVPTADVAGVIRRLVDGETSWDDVREKYPEQAAKEDN